MTKSFQEAFPYLRTPSVDIVVSTENPTFTLINELDVTQATPAGEYEIVLSYVWAMADTNDSALFRFDVDGVTGETFVREPKDANDRVYRSLVVPITSTGAPINFKFYGAVTIGGQPLTVTDCVITYSRRA